MPPGGGVQAGFLEEVTPGRGWARRGWWGEERGTDGQVAAGEGPSVWEEHQ